MNLITRTSLTLTLCAAPLVAGCATAAPVGSSAEQPTATRGDRNALTRDEILDVPQSSMYAVVRSLRPQWLRARGPNSVSGGGQVQVYVDGVRMGGPQSMQRINPATVLRASYMSSSTATTRYGTDHTRGAILLFTREP